MTLDDLRLSAGRDAGPPPTATAPIRALWYDARGEWDRAHQCVQDDDGAAAAWVHAYLHRKEGDLGNAGYWYARARRPRPPEGTTLDAEWADLARALLAEVPPKKKL